MKKHDICHIGWQSTDPERTRRFLIGMFQWNVEEWSEKFNYMLYTTPSGLGGGIAKVEKVEPAKSPKIFVLVDEIEPYLEKVVELGGNVVTSVRESPGPGWFAFITDPDGNLIGLWKGRKL